MVTANLSVYKLLVLVAFLDVVKAQTCVDPTQRKITGNCTTTTIDLYTPTQNLDFNIYVDAQPAISALVTITLTVGNCAVKAKAFQTQLGKNLLSVVDDTIFAPSFRLRATDKSFDVMSSTDSSKRYNTDQCTPQFNIVERKFKINVRWESSAEEKTVYLQFNNEADFNMPTTTTVASSGSGSGSSFPTWGYIVLGVFTLLIILCILVAIAVCVRLFCWPGHRHRQQATTKVDIGVQEPPPPLSVCPSNFGAESVHASRLSIVSDFDSLPPSEYNNRGVTDL